MTKPYMFMLPMLSARSFSPLSIPWTAANSALGHHHSGKRGVASQISAQSIKSRVQTRRKITHATRYHTKQRILTNSGGQNERTKLICKFVLGSFVGSCCVHAIGARVFKTLYITSRAPLPPLQRKDIVTFGGKCAASVHGLLVGLGGLYSVCRGDFVSNTVFVYPSICDRLFSITTGYQIYEIIVMVAQGVHTLPMWLHHLVVLFGCIAIMVMRVGTWYPAIFLLSELTPFPSNVEWFLKKFGLAHTLAFKATLTARLASYFLFRTFIGPIAIAHGLRLGQLGQLTQIPPLASFLCVFNVIALSVLNTSWTFKLIRHVLRQLKCE